MVRSIRLGALLALALLAAPVAARADEPPFVEWTALLPGLTTEYAPSSDNDCAAGRTQCVDAVIREMRRRFAPLAAACDHDAIEPAILEDAAKEMQPRSISCGAFFILYAVFLRQPG